MNPEPILTSFVLRFIHDEPPGGASGGWHGVIRHVQTNSERQFTRWSEAVSFISQFVDVSEGAREDGRPQAG